jgi:hypothetical protein
MKKENIRRYEKNMSISYGDKYRINRFATPTYYGLGGTVMEATIDPDAEIATEVGCGEGTRTIAFRKITAVRPKVSWTQNVRKLADYITLNAMITAEGAVPEHSLALDEGGGGLHLFTGCKVNTCRITIRQAESIKAALEVLAKDRSTQSSWTFVKTSETAMYKTALTTLSIGGTPETKWQEVEFGVDNNVIQEILGVQIKPMEVGERQALYSGHIIRAVAQASLVPDVIAGTPKTIIITLTDNQATPVAKTFTFTNAELRRSQVRARGLDMVIERIEWEGKTMVIT